MKKRKTNKGLYLFNIHLPIRFLEFNITYNNDFDHLCNLLNNNVPDTVLFHMHYFICFHNNSMVGILITSILQLRFINLKKLAQDHTSGKTSQDSNQSLSHTRNPCS